MQACCYLATRLARPVARAVLPRLAADFLVGMISASVSAAVSSKLSEASPPASCCSFNRLPLLLAATCLASGSAVWVAGVFLFLGACFCFASSGSSALPSSVSLALSEAPTDAFLLLIALLGAAVQTEVAASVAAVHQESGSNGDQPRGSCCVADMWGPGCDAVTQAGPCTLKASAQVQGTTCCCLLRHLLHFRDEGCGPATDCDYLDGPATH